MYDEQDGLNADGSDFEMEGPEDSGNYLTPFGPHMLFDLSQVAFISATPIIAGEKNAHHTATIGYKAGLVKDLTGEAALEVRRFADDVRTSYAAMKARQAERAKERAEKAETDRVAAREAAREQEPATVSEDKATQQWGTLETGTTT